MTMLFILFSRFYNDNVILFTDGMANEGLTDTDTLTEEMNNHIDVVKDECQFDDDYTIKLATLGTGGFYPGNPLVWRIGRASDYGSRGRRFTPLPDVIKCATLPIKDFFTRDNDLESTICMY